MHPRSDQLSSSKRYRQWIPYKISSLFPTTTSNKGRTGANETSNAEGHTTNHFWTYAGFWAVQRPLSEYDDNRSPFQCLRTSMQNYFLIKILSDKQFYGCIAKIAARLMNMVKVMRVFSIYGPIIHRRGTCCSFNKEIRASDEISQTGLHMALLYERDILHISTFSSIRYCSSSLCEIFNLDLENWYKTGLS